MAYTYMTKGTCSRSIDVELEGNIIKSVSFLGGCHGNLQGISKLVEGMSVEEATKRLRGICCGSKTTSCPDQLTIALEEAMKAQQ